MCYVGRSLCDERIARSEEPYRVWIVCLFILMCDLEYSTMRRLRLELLASGTEKNMYVLHQSVKFRHWWCAWLWFGAESNCSRSLFVRVMTARAYWKESASAISSSVVAVSVRWCFVYCHRLVSEHQVLFQTSTSVLFNVYRLVNSALKRN